MIQKTLNIFTSLLIISCCLLACNTEKFRPKPKSSVPETQVQDEPKQMTAQDEQEEELIGPASLDYDNVDESGNGIYGRQIAPSFYEQVEEIKKNADPKFKGVLKIITCIDPSGIILMARPDIDKTTMKELDLQRKVGKVLICLLYTSPSPRD